jgi:hypothetical protein
VYESYKQPLIPRREFILRVVWHTLLAVGALIGWVAVGVVGYGVLAHLSLIDAFLNAAMIAGGMGPVDTLTDDGAKLFAGMYALFSGIIIIAAAGVVLAPILHRLLHTLHLDDFKDDGDDDSPG